MTRVALLTDTHFGVRGDQVAFLQHMHWFFQHVFFSKLIEYDVKTIIHLGDLVDRRKYINYHTLRRMKDSFLDEILERKIDMHIIAGNHDHYWRNTWKLNSLEELLYGYDFKVYTEPAMLRLGSRDTLMVPWITEDNREQTMDLLAKRSPHCLVFGHLELKGFTMNPGTVAEHGDESEPYEKFAGVYSGHYHSKSSKGNIHYLGAPFQFTWGDYGDTRGFHILDTETLELTFIDNPYSMFSQLYYDDRYPETQDFAELCEVRDCYVKIIVKHKKSQAEFERFLKIIEAKMPLDLKIVETVQLDVDNDTFDGAETTSEIIRKYIGQINVSNQPQLEKKMLSLYERALLAE